MSMAKKRTKLDKNAHVLLRIRGVSVPNNAHHGNGSFCVQSPPTPPQEVRVCAGHVEYERLEREGTVLSAASV